MQSVLPRMPKWLNRRKVRMALMKGYYEPRILARDLHLPVQSSARTLPSPGFAALQSAGIVGTVS